MRKVIPVAVAAALALAVPADADAQRRYGHRSNDFSFSPYAGVYMDAYDFEADDSNVGWIAGFKAGYRATQRFNLHLDLGYAQVDDVSSRPLPTDPVVDNEWVLMTGGGDFALVPGNTSIAIGADLGVGWRRTKTDGGGAPEDRSWAAYEVVAPSLTVRHQFTPRAGIFASAHDYIFDVLEGSAQHSPAFTVGLTIR